MSAALHQTKDDPPSDNAAADSFVGFDDDDSEEDQSMGEDEHDRFDSSDDEDELAHYNKRKSRKHKKQIDATFVDDEKDSDEEGLERFVLGNKASFREQLFRDDFLGLATSEAAGKELVLAEGGQEQVEDSALFFFDQKGAAADGKSKTIDDATGTAEAEAAAPAVWEDSDDERLTVSLAGATRLRKLRATEAEDLVSGAEYARRLRQQYLRLYPVPSWAKEATDAANKKDRRRRRSSAGSSSRGSAASGSEMDTSDEEELDPSALPLEMFLRDAASFNGAGARKRRKLRPETIDIQRTRDIPDSHKAAVSSLSFHPTRPILLSSCVSSIMYLHHIDPTAHPTPNPLLTSVQVKSTDLRRSAFLGPESDEIIFSGRRRYFHSWNISTGLVKKVTQIQGHQREQRTMEHFRLSPDGRHMALVSSDKKGGGMVNIINVKTMQWVAQARPNGRGGVSDMCWWSTGDGLTILGKDGQVTEWSIITRRTVGVWRDEGSIGGTVIALGGGGRYAGSGGGPSEIGGDRWVAVGSNSGILNVYDRNELVVTADKGVVELKARPEPTRAFDQLTTAISVVAFSPDGQLLAFGSVHKKDALRLVHLPSCTVYRNWPTDQTPLGRVTAVAFSEGSDILAVGNDVGKVRMWEIRN
ncbi:WD40-repeat-containing domain protein [Apodospora peruviana]|uniref:WD40-repeat-containing domain protein n=1 Tax=Apodospora peruviana TaxID=516989 RepID=A0AAE0IPX8_9PEZI|nr:WD40-repeat-containing domain protein [Apodospora peruviana]